MSNAAYLLNNNAAPNKLTRPEDGADAESASQEEIDSLRQAAEIIARAEVSDAVAEALSSYEGTLRDLQNKSGLDPAFVSKLARGVASKRGGTVASLAQIALALNKTLKITIE